MTNIQTYGWISAAPPEPTLEQLEETIKRLELEKRAIELQLEIAKIHQQILALTKPTITWTGGSYQADK